DAFAVWLGACCVFVVQLFSRSCIAPCSFPCYGVHRHLHSFPTRRSSDLGVMITSRFVAKLVRSVTPGALWRVSIAVPLAERASRSEEHTSELQSRVDLVCRLWLEKEKMLAVGAVGRVSSLEVS